MKLAFCAGTIACAFDMCLGAHVGSLLIACSVLLFPTRYPINNPEQMSVFFLIAESVHLGLIVGYGSFDRLRLTPPPSVYEIGGTLVISVCAWLAYWLLPAISFGKRVVHKQTPPPIRKTSTPTEEPSTNIVVDCFL